MVQKICEIYPGMYNKLQDPKQWPDKRVSAMYTRMLNQGKLYK